MVVDRFDTISILGSEDFVDKISKRSTVTGEIQPD